MTTINKEEIQKFSKIADEWWNTSGKFKPLHMFNPVRIEYILEKVCDYFKLEKNKSSPLQNIKILDIGCGGGLISEPMSRLGAEVTGIDASYKNIQVAKIHAEKSDLNINYVNKSPEQLDENNRYDVILNLEIVEHVDDLDLYLLGNGFKDETKPGFNPQVDKSMQKARSYIQVNGPILVKLLAQQADLEDKLKEINNTENEDAIETSKILLNKPKYLDKERIIGSFNNLETDVGIYNYRYSISAWIFLHEEPPNFRTSSTKFTRLLSYAENPEISFNLEKHMLKITVKKADGTKRVVYKNNKIPMQRWNNFIITNTGGTIDIFINGILVSSTPNTVPHMKYDSIIAGTRNGVSGGICNVTYFSYPMTRRQIQFLYNNFKGKNPPII